MEDSTVQKRFELCKYCPRHIIEGTTVKCGICGCKSLGPDDKALLNLAKFVEAPNNTGYGCFFHAEKNQAHPGDIENRSKWAQCGLSGIPEIDDKVTDEQARAKMLEYDVPKEIVDKFYPE